MWVLRKAGAVSMAGRLVLVLREELSGVVGRSVGVIWDERLSVREGDEGLGAVGAVGATG